MSARSLVTHHTLCGCFLLVGSVSQATREKAELAAKLSQLGAGGQASPALSPGGGGGSGSGGGGSGGGGGSDMGRRFEELREE